MNKAESEKEFVVYGRPQEKINFLITKKRK